VSKCESKGENLGNQTITDNVKFGGQVTCCSPAISFAVCQGHPRIQKFTVVEGLFEALWLVVSSGAIVSHLSLSLQQQIKYIIFWL
jgi:hypothetical protein